MHGEGWVVRHASIAPTAEINWSLALFEQAAPTASAQWGIATVTMPTGAAIQSHRVRCDVHYRTTVTAISGPGQFFLLVIDPIAVFQRHTASCVGWISLRRNPPCCPLRIISTLKQRWITPAANPPYVTITARRSIAGGAITVVARSEFRKARQQRAGVSGFRDSKLVPRN